MSVVQTVHWQTYIPLLYPLLLSFLYRLLALGVATASQSETIGGPSSPEVLRLPPPSSGGVFRSQSPITNLHLPEVFHPPEVLPLRRSSSSVFRRKSPGGSLRKTSYIYPISCLYYIRESGKLTTSQTINTINVQAFSNKITRVY